MRGGEGEESVQKCISQQSTYYLGRLWSISTMSCSCHEKCLSSFSFHKGDVDPLALPKRYHLVTLQSFYQVKNILRSKSFLRNEGRQKKRLYLLVCWTYADIGWLDWIVILRLKMNIKLYVKKVVLVF